MKKYAIIVAGGKGLRMGGDLPKQFIPVQERPVLMRTLDAFHASDASIQLILVLPRDHQTYWRELCSQYHFIVPHQIADGGTTRFHSVLSGLSFVKESEALVAVHDGVRPFVSREVIEQCYTDAEVHGAAIPVVPVVETVRHLLENTSETVDRNAYRLVQTPQTFRASLLRKAYEQPFRDTFTDDASVVEAMGCAVHLVDGNRENIKLTTPYDLIVAKALIDTGAWL